MFGSAIFPVKRSENDGPKKTPPAPTKITFPASPELDEADKEIIPLRVLESHFRTKSYQNFTLWHLKTIGLVSNGSLPIEHVVDSEFIPSVEWKNDPSTLSENQKSAAIVSSTQTLSNGAAVPGHETFYIRMKELRYESDDVYRFVDRRAPAPGRQPIKVVHFRNFWIKHQLVGGYWDTSLDNVEYSPQAEQERDKAKDSVQHQSKSVQDSSVTTNTASEAASNIEQESQTYTGRRHGTGSSMPAKLREDLARAFMEPILSAFGCRFDPPQKAPKFVLGTSRLDADHSGRIYRLPMDRNRGRAGIVEGPLMVLHSVPELNWGAHNKNIDLAFNMRELCVLLSAAQERHRQGKFEKSHEDKWWANAAFVQERSRSPTGEPLTPDTITPEMERAKARQKKNAQRPPAPVWEKRVAYLKIGKPHDSDIDTVFLVSSIATHISILRLDIHAKMLDHLEGNLSTPIVDRSQNTSGASWYGMKLRRSKWYNFFEVEDRVEAMRALWAVMGWMMRDTDAEKRATEDGVADTEMTDTSE